MKNVIYICICALVAVLAFSSCNDEIDIRQDYDFSLSSWYLQKQIATGETVEIRFSSGYSEWRRSGRSERST